MPRPPRNHEAPSCPSREGSLRLPDPFPLESGEHLAGGNLDYWVAGPDRAPVVVVLGGISAVRRVDRWWPAMVGPDRAIDVDRFRVLGIDWLGHRAESFPRSTGATGLSYPLITTRDQAHALVVALDALGIERIRALVGSSYGAMVGLAMAAEYPERVDRLVAISGAHRTHPMATAHRAVQRRILALAGGTSDPDEGLILARALAMTTYRTVDEFEARFPPYALPDTGGRFAVEEYLLARGRAFRERFRPETFAALSHSIDLHRVDPEDVTTPVELVSVDSDLLVPTWLMEELESRLGGPCHHHRLRSAWGHDAFLKETDAIGRVLRRALLREAPPRGDCAREDLA